jgi:hypothetical protein
MTIRQAMLLGSCILAVSLPVWADSGWTEFGNVVELVPTSRHYYQVKLSIDSKLSGCKDRAGFYQDYGTSGSEQMFEALLAAVKSGKRVRVYVTGKCNLDGYSEISAVGVIP